MAYLWTANGVVIRDSDQNNAWHHYEYLVDGFLSGHLSLSVKPAPELLALPDPYDPAQNLKYRVWDVSLYKGKYYLYYGPTPALLLMLPWKVLTGHHMPQRIAAAVFASLGLGALALLLAGLRRTYFPTVGPVAFAFVVFLAGHITWLPVILRRPAFWELPIIAAACLLWWSMYCLWRYLESAHRVRWGIACGACLGFLLGARPTFVFSAGLLALIPALPLNRGVSWREYARRVLPVLVPFALGLAALFAYNYERFGSILEFGQSYQLWGPNGQVNYVDERHIQHFSAAFIPFNAWLYLFSIPVLGVYFPFIHAPWIIDLPHGYIATEAVYGLVPIVPALLTGLVALAKCRGAWGRADAQYLRTITIAAAVVSALSAAILFCFAGACSRYVVELVAGWSVVSAIGMLSLVGRGNGPLWDRVLRLLGYVAAFWSVACVWLASYEFRAFARITQPHAYPIIAGLFNYPSYWCAKNTHQEFGPVVLQINLADNPQTGTAILMGAGSDGMLNQLILERPSPTEFRLRLTVNALIMLETPVLHATGQQIVVKCAAPWLYPPAAHPFWREFPEAGDRERRQTTYLIAVNGVEYSARSWWGFDATAFDPFVRTSKQSTGACAWVTSWSRVSAIAGSGAKSASNASAQPYDQGNIHEAFRRHSVLQ